jgi:hypothetical protein
MLIIFLITKNWDYTYFYFLLLLDCYYSFFINIILENKITKCKSVNVYQYSFNFLMLLYLKMFMRIPMF